MKIVFHVLFTIVFFSTTYLDVFAQNTLLQSGPMVGHIDVEEVVLWVQTKKEAAVKFKYWEKGKPAQAKYSATAFSKKDHAYAVSITLEGLQGGKTYQYDLYLNKKKVSRPYETSFKTQPIIHINNKTLPETTFAIGSCFYTHDEKSDRPGSIDYGADVKIMERIAKDKPEMMVWMGDNTYYNRPHWTTKTGMQRRMTQTRSVPELQALLGATGHYAIWDDHDYGKNDSDRSNPLKYESLEVFKDFWTNPNYALGENKGITGSLVWYDIEFFFLDNRWFRTPNRLYSGERTYLGEEQLTWLKEALASSHASFKFIVVGGQVINSAAVYENYATYAVERLRLYQAIRDSRAWGVVFLDGDRHHTVLRKMKLPGMYPFYDLTCSPLTAGAHDMNLNEQNAQIVEGTTYGKKNYGLLKVSGPKGDRVLKIKIKDVDGKLVWEKEIRQKELK